MKMSNFTLNEEKTGWNNPNKTPEQKALLKDRGNLLNKRMRYALDTKILLAQRRIRSAIYEYGEENCYISFSGGKDSAVLSHLVSSMGFKLEHVFSNTRLEYPECIKFAKEWCKKYGVKLTMVMPEVMPQEIWKKYGYPMFSKEISEIMERLRTGRSVPPKKMKKIKGFLKYKDVKLSARCCHFFEEKTHVKLAKREWEKSSNNGC